MSQTTLTDDELFALVRERGHVIVGAKTPTVKELAVRWLPTLPSKRSRNTYRTHVARLCAGIGPICDARCTPCMVAPDFFRLYATRRG